MEKIKKINYKDKEILVVDFSGCKEMAMIEVFDRTNDLILKENKHVLLLSVFKKGTYITPNFVRHIEREINKTAHLIDKNTITGLSSIQKWILKGVNLWSQNQILHFETFEDALEFLVTIDT